MLFFRIANFVLRCRHVLRRLCSISCLEVAAAADAILAPVRVGMVKANWPIMMTAGQDALEVSNIFEDDSLSLSDMKRTSQSFDPQKIVDHNERGKGSSFYL